MDPRLNTKYALSKPISTHRRPASCEEVNCKHWRQGWQMHIMEGTPVGDRQKHLVKLSGRKFVRTQESPTNFLYTFEAGQTCFGAHSVPIERPAIYLVRQGAGPVKQHVNPEDWVDDFSTHLDKIREQ